MFEPTFTLEGPNTYSQGIGEFWKTRDTACVISKKCKCKHTHQVCIVTSKVPSVSRDNPSLTSRVIRYCQNFRVAHCISAHKAPLNALGTRTKLLALTYYPFTPGHRILEFIGTFEIACIQLLHTSIDVNIHTLELNSSTKINKNTTPRIFGITSLK